MRFSRQFATILNNATEESGKDLRKLREIVTNWIAGRPLGQQDARWLNRRTLRHRSKLVSLAGVPEVVTDFEIGNPPHEKVAVTSFVEFLAEVEDSRTSGAGRLNVQICPACKSFFIQEDSGRTSVYCSSRCMFRIRREALRRLQEKGEDTNDAEIRREAIRRLLKEATEDL